MCVMSHSVEVAMVTPNEWQKNWVRGSVVDDFYTTVFCSAWSLCSWNVCEAAWEVYWNYSPTVWTISLINIMYNRFEEWPSIEASLCLQALISQFPWCRNKCQETKCQPIFQCPWFFLSCKDGCYVQLLFI